MSCHVCFLPYLHLQRTQALALSHDSLRPHPPPPSEAICNNVSCFWSDSEAGCDILPFTRPLLCGCAVPATPGATDAPYEGTGPIPQAGVGGVGSVGSLPAGGAASALAALLTGTRTAAAAGPPVGLASVREPLAAVNPQPSALAPVVQIVGTLGAERGTNTTIHMCFSLTV